MKIKIALILVALAFLPACESTWTASHTPHSEAHFANGADGEEPAPPAEGPADINANPAYVAAQFRRGQPLADQRSVGAAALRRLIASPNESICASECAALTVTRRRAAPFATVG